MLDNITIYACVQYVIIMVEMRITQNDGNGAMPSPIANASRSFVENLTLDETPNSFSFTLTIYI